MFHVCILKKKKISADEGGICHTTSELVNPLGLRDRKTEKLSNTELNSINNSSLLNIQRRKRDVEMIVRKGPDNVVRMVRYFDWLPILFDYLLLVVIFFFFSRIVQLALQNVLNSNVLFTNF